MSVFKYTLFNISMKTEEYYPSREMRLPKRRQWVLLLARVILTKYYPARNMLSTNKISNVVNINEV